MFHPGGLLYGVPQIIYRICDPCASAGFIHHGGNDPVVHILLISIGILKGLDDIFRIHVKHGAEAFLVFMDDADHISFLQRKLKSF